MLTNGNLYQFGRVILLEHSFPVLHIATGVFDASVSVTRELIAKHLIRIKGFCLDPPVTFNLNKYHLNSFTVELTRWPEKPQESFGYLLKIYDQLADV